MQELGYNEKNKILLALTLTKNVGSSKILEIIESSNGFSSGVDEAIRLALSAAEMEMYLSISSAIDKEISYLTAFNIGIFSYLDSFYPEQLKLLSDPPVILYFKGSYSFMELGELFSRQRLGVVGSRKILNQTKHLVNNLLGSLEGFGIVSVSGLAYGVDSELHSSSLKYKIPTIAVTAGGVNFPSPSGNAKLYNEILENGLVISECFPKKSIAPGNFAHRNRIVAALSDVLLVAQAAKDSGSIITPRLAYPIGVKIFAASSAFDDKDFAGCHDLISEGVAKIYLSASNLAESFGINLSKIDNYRSLSLGEKIILEFINKNKLVSMEEIMFATVIERAELMSLLMNMSFDGLIASDMNGLYYVL